LSGSSRREWRAGLSRGPGRQVPSRHASGSVEVAVVLAGEKEDTAALAAAPADPVAALRARTAVVNAAVR
jgi:hypothetical protein